MELKALRSIVKSGRNDLFFCADAGQQIYRSPFSWASCGLDIKGRSSRLRINYRTTSQIKSFSEAVLPAGTSDEENVENREVISLMSGPEPKVYCYNSVAEEKEALKVLVTELIGAGVNPHELACLPWPLTSRCTSAIRKAPGSAIPTRTPTACCGSIFPKAPTCRYTLRQS